MPLCFLGSDEVIRCTYPDVFGGHSVGSTRAGHRIFARAAERAEREEWDSAGPWDCLPVKTAQSRFPDPIPDRQPIRLAFCGVVDLSNQS